MYQWRQMSPEQRAEILHRRQGRHLPWHAPPHIPAPGRPYLVTAACYEHSSIIGATADRLAGFEQALLDTAHLERVYAWVVLPNHYHLLIETPDLKEFFHELGLLHGRSSHEWNGQDDRRGRRVWYRAVETAMKSERHFWATMNYVLHNPVRHGYVRRWQDWPYSSARMYLAELSRPEAERRWREYPITDCGKDWDPPEL